MTKITFFCQKRHSWECFVKLSLHCTFRESVVCYIVFGVQINGTFMELQNIPTKLVNKFKKANIKTVEDLQKNYNRLINGLGFGGIFVAALLDYMQREGI